MHNITEVGIFTGAIPTDVFPAWTHDGIERMNQKTILCVTHSSMSLCPSSPSFPSNEVLIMVGYDYSAVFSSVRQLWHHHHFRIFFYQLPWITPIEANKFVVFCTSTAFESCSIPSLSAPSFVDGPERTPHISAVCRPQPNRCGDCTCGGTGERLSLHTSFISKCIDYANGFQSH